MHVLQCDTNGFKTSEHVLIRKTTRTDRTCFVWGILCYLDYLKSVFIQNMFLIKFVFYYIHITL